jgi:catechol 2,3-dioxygenase-like lactoylglutathione lyase family enzyme
MNFTGVDRVVYGVEDMAKSRQFFTDWGLKLAGDSNGCPVFETLDGTEIVLSPADDKDLPPAIEPGSTARRVVWGVASEADLDAVRGRIGKLEGFAEEAWGPSITDPNGLRISFRVTRRRNVAITGSPCNTIDKDYRNGTRNPVYTHAEPYKVGHVVFFSPDVMAAVKFYTDVLGFIISDSYPGGGYFLRCEKIGGHHDLFLLQTPDKKRGLNHVSFTLRDIHEVFGGGIAMNGKGWKTQIGPGRHPISSAYFWYVHCPAGAVAEYYSNEDICGPDWKAAEWERNNTNFAEWAIAGGIDAASRRQVQPA